MPYASRHTGAGRPGRIDTAGLWRAHNDLSTSEGTPNYTQQIEDYSGKTIRLCWMGWQSMPSHHILLLMSSGREMRETDGIKLDSVQSSLLLINEFNCTLIEKFQGH